MSLDVYLYLKENEKSLKAGSGIFARENGQIREITRAEWDEKFPGLEPVVNEEDEWDEWDELDCVYTANITHNLNVMADEAGIYEALWRPDQIKINYAKELIIPLENGLNLLRNTPNRFKELNPSNGWGTYEGLIEFVAEYLAACKKYPDATVEVSR